MCCPRDGSRSKPFQQRQHGALGQLGQSWLRRYVVAKPAAVPNRMRSVIFVRVRLSLRQGARGEASLGRVRALCLHARLCAKRCACMPVCALSVLSEFG